MQTFYSSIRKLGPIALTYFTIFSTCGLPAHGQQSSQSNNTLAFAQYSQREIRVSYLLRAPPVTPTPTPTPRGEGPQTDAQTGMASMESEGAPSQDAGMGDDMMGAAGLVPPGIMVGNAGRWMVGYQIMFDKMDGNLVGTDRVTDAKVLERFMATPTDMAMQMHMGMVMYAPTDKLTLMAMVPYIRKSMNHVMRDGKGRLHYRCRCANDLRGAVSASAARVSWAGVVLELV